MFLLMVLSVLVCIGALADSTNPTSGPTTGLLLAPTNTAAIPLPGGATNPVPRYLSPAEQAYVRWLDSAAHGIPSHLEGWVVLSKPVSNLSVYFGGVGHDPSAFPADQQIVVGFLSRTNRWHAVVKLEPEYAYRLLLRDEDGEVVAPTSVGNRYGKKFDALKVYDKSAVTESRSYRVVAAPASPGSVLPAPQDLFKLTKPGRYTLFVEAQCFYGSFPGTYPFTNLYPLRFPPVKLPIVKREK